MLWSQRPEESQGFQGCSCEGGSDWQVSRYTIAITSQGIRTSFIINQMLILINNIAE
jgi:hypothetical protein